jgi:hypothetical protein
MCEIVGTGVILEAYQQTTSKELTVKYKLNVARDVDTDEPDTYILNLPNGWRFDDDLVHTRGYDTMSELRKAVKTEVIPCNCKSCIK